MKALILLQDRLHFWVKIYDIVEYRLVRPSDPHPQKNFSSHAVTLHRNDLPRHLLTCDKSTVVSETHRRKNIICILSINSKFENLLLLLLCVCFFHKIFLSVARF